MLSTAEFRRRWILKADSVELLLSVLTTCRCYGGLEPGRESFRKTHGNAGKPRA